MLMCILISDVEIDPGCALIFDCLDTDDHVGLLHDAMPRLRLGGSSRGKGSYQRDCGGFIHVIPSHSLRLCELLNIYRVNLFSTSPVRTYSSNEDFGDRV